MALSHFSTTSGLPNFLIKEAVHKALKEDLGEAGDITTNTILTDNIIATGLIMARKPGIIAGLELAKEAFISLSNKTVFEAKLADGARVNKGDIIAQITAPGRTLLSAERVALNFLCHLSGIATLTHSFVEKIRDTSSHICDTRKTTPGLRIFEKYAVRIGGGRNHRFGLDDAVMIKDNHIALAGSLKNAIERVKQNIGHMVKVEVEVDTLEQLDELLNYEIDVVLLDNMAQDVLRQAVARVGKRFVTEASGGITLDNVRTIAETQVDFISIGALTHSAPILDLGLDFD